MLFTISNNEAGDSVLSLLYGMSHLFPQMHTFESKGLADTEFVKRHLCKIYLDSGKIFTTAALKNFCYCTSNLIRTKTEPCPTYRNGYYQLTSTKNVIISVISINVKITLIDFAPTVKVSVTRPNLPLMSGEQVTFFFLMIFRLFSSIVAFIAI